MYKGLYHKETQPILIDEQPNDSDSERISEHVYYLNPMIRKNRSSSSKTQKSKTHRTKSRNSDSLQQFDYKSPDFDNYLKKIKNNV